MTIVINGETKLVVYLGGGFHSNWQEEVVVACDTKYFHFMNPKFEWVSAKEDRKTEEEKEAWDKVQTQSPWWHWDKLAVKMSDIVFLNWEDYKDGSGHRGAGDIFEAGMSWAYDKLIIIVNFVNHRYYRGIARNFLVFETFEEGIECLKRCAWLVKPIVMSDIFDTLAVDKPPD